jgi:hypothetical protein
LATKALDPDWIRIRIGLQHQTLDPDPEKGIRIHNPVSTFTLPIPRS